MWADVVPWIGKCRRIPSDRIVDFFCHWGFTPHVASRQCLSNWCPVAQVEEKAFIEKGGGRGYQSPSFLHSSRPLRKWVLP